jgi:hypothetical protein
MSRATMRLLGLLILLLADAAAPTASLAQQLPKSTDSTSEHVFIDFKLGSLDTPWRSNGSNRWQLKTRAGTWVDFPPEGAEIRYYAGTRGPGWTSMILRVRHDRQDDIMAFAKAIDTCFAKVLTKPYSSFVEELQSSSDVVVHASGGPGLTSALQIQGFVSLQKRFDGLWCPNDHLSIRVPLARLEAALTVISKFPTIPGPCKF